MALDRAGVGHETKTEQFFQKLFATWFQLDHMPGRIPLNRLQTWPVDERELYYNLGAKAPPARSERFVPVSRIAAAETPRVSLDLP